MSTASPPHQPGPGPATAAPPLPDAAATKAGGKQKTKKRKRAHGGFVSPLPSSEEAVQANPAPATAPRVLRPTNQPPPKKAGVKGPASWKKNLGPKTGLWRRRVDGEIDMDHFGSLNYKSACGPSCKKECHQGRLSDMSQQQFGQVVKSAQDAVRGAYKSLNGAGFPRKQPGADKVVRDRMMPVWNLAGANTEVLRRRRQISPQQGFVKGGCRWCNTIIDVGPGNDRNHQCREGPCPCYDDAKVFARNYAPSHWKYTLQPSADGGRPFEVSRPFFQAVYQIGQLRLKRLKLSHTKVNPLDADSKTGKHNNQKKLRHADIKRFEKIMAANLSASGNHYVKHDDACKLQSFAQNVTRASLWWEFCERYDKPFTDQAKRLGYRHSLDKKDQCPSLEIFAQDIALKQIKPRVSYERARLLFKDYNVRFGKIAVDTCETCETLRFKISHAPPNSRKQKDLLEQQRIHMEKADKSYAFRKADHERAQSDKEFACADGDFAGGFRTPWVPLQVAYYSRIVPMANFMICGPDFVDMYGYDETIAGKGPDEVCSFVYHWLCAEKQRKPDLKHAVFWCDACGGQSWNQYLFRLAHEVCNPLSVFYIPGLCRVDIKKATSGHSYLWCDRVIVPIKAKARLCQGGIVSAFKSSMLPDRFKERTWEHCIVNSTINGNKYRLHRVTQPMVYAFKEFWGRRESLLVKGKSHDKSKELMGKGSSQEVLYYVANDGKNRGDKFSSQQICWVTAGSLDRGSAGLSGEGCIDHRGELWCKGAYDNTSPWGRVPLFRPEKKKTKNGAVVQVGVTWGNYRTEQAKQMYKFPDILYSELLKLSVLKQNDLHKLGRSIAGGNDLDIIYPAPDSAAVTAAKKKRDEKTVAKKRHALGEPVVEVAGKNGAGAASSSSRSSSSTSRSLNPDSQIQLVQNAFASAQAPMVPGGGAAPMMPP
jgi:hypothetical protein